MDKFNKLYKLIMQELEHPDMMNMIDPEMDKFSKDELAQELMMSFETWQDAQKMLANQPGEGDPTVALDIIKDYEENKWGTADYLALYLYLNDKNFEVDLDFPKDEPSALRWIDNCEDADREKCKYLIKWFNPDLC